ncbi:MAG: hypothetical protein QM756_20660 [Polyangiaceae bacterium]
MRRLFSLFAPLSLTLASVAHAEPPSSPPEKDSVAPASTRPSNGVECPTSRQRLAIAGDFVPYLGASSAESGRAAQRNFSFNLVGGYAGSLRGFELGSVFNLERGCVEGAQVAGVFNAAGGNVRGLQVGGVANLNEGSVRGLQVAGMVNVTGPLRAALQVGGTANIVAGDALGAQFSGASNVVTGSVRGLQLSGVANIAAYSVNGAQIGGAFNYGGDEVNGLQLAPINFSSGRVRGAQIGVVNIAEKSDASVGVININTKGRTQVEGWTAVETGFLAAALKHGGDHWHGLYGLGTRVSDPELSLVLGLGGDMPIGEHFYFGADAVGYWAPRFKKSNQLATLVQTRAYFGVRILKPLSVFAGGSYNVFLADKGAKDWSPDYAERANSAGEPRVRLWPGAIVGVRLLSE